MRDVLGSVYADEDFTELFAIRGRPALVPWRLALVTMLQFAEGLQIGRLPTRCTPALTGGVHWGSR
jgi:hypothetical protein